MTISPLINDLYDHLKEKEPWAYEMLTQIDREIADLHARGLHLSRTRIAILENVYSTKALGRVKENLGRLMRPVDVERAVIYGEKL